MKVIEYWSYISRLADAQWIINIYIKKAEIPEAPREELIALNNEMRSSQARFIEHLNQSLDWHADIDPFTAVIPPSDIIEGVLPKANQQIEGFRGFIIDGTRVFQPVSSAMEKIRDEMLKIIETELVFIEKCRALDVAQVRERMDYLIYNAKIVSIQPGRTDEFNQLMDQLVRINDFVNPLGMGLHQLRSFAQDILSGINFFHRKFLSDDFMQHFETQKQFSLSLSAFMDVIGQLRTKLIVAWARAVSNFNLPKPCNAQLRAAMKSLRQAIKTPEELGGNVLYQNITNVWQHADEVFKDENVGVFSLFETDFNLLINELGGIVALPTRRSTTYGLLVNELRKPRRLDVFQEFVELNAPDTAPLIIVVSDLVDEIHRFTVSQAEQANAALIEHAEHEAGAKQQYARQARKEHRLEYLTNYLAELKLIHDTQAKRREDANPLNLHKDRMQAKIIYCKTMDESVQAFKDSIENDNFDDNFSLTLQQLHANARQQVTEQGFRVKDIHSGLGNSSLRTLNHEMIINLGDCMDVLTEEAPRFLV